LAPSAIAKATQSNSRSSLWSVCP